MEEGSTPGVQPQEIQNRVDEIFDKMKQELVRAYQKHPGKNASRHHHYGVIAEEFREYEECTFKDFVPGGREELIQLGAMCARALLETPQK